MQRTNGKEVRGRRSLMRQTTLPYAGRPSPIARVPQSQQPPFRASYQASPRAAAPSPRVRGAPAASNGPRPGILQKPIPKLQQQQPRQQLVHQPRAPFPSWNVLQKPIPKLQQQQPPRQQLVHQPRAPLPSWRPSAPQPHGTVPRAGNAVQRPAFGNVNRAQPVTQLRNQSGTAYRMPPQSDVVPAGIVEAAGPPLTNDETGGFRIPSYGVATAKGTRGLCEVFGVLDSTPTASRHGLVKHFTLREERSSVNCVFYQIDRPLGQLKRGTVLRCIGFMNRTGQLSVVSARPATDDEKKLLEVLSTITAV